MPHRRRLFHPPCTFARVLLLGLSLCFPVPGLARPAPPEQAAAPLQDAFAVDLQVALAGAGGSVRTASGTLDKAPQLRRLYQGRAYQAIWTEAAGLGRNGLILWSFLQDAWQDGLPLEAYHVPRIAGLLERLPAEASARMQVELLLSHAFLRYSTDLRQGRVDPRQVSAGDWTIFNRQQWDPVAALENALRDDALLALLQDLPPRHPDYHDLRAARQYFQVLAAQGEWPVLPDGDSLRPGDFSESVPVLRERLARGGDLPALRSFTLLGQRLSVPWAWQAMGGMDDPHYDPVLVSAVLRFQARHGLEPDAVVGPFTRAALNVSIRERIRQIEVNQERWRWLPRDLGARYVMVNVPGFELGVFEYDQHVMRMPVIVGTAYRRTPVFRSDMTQIIFNPKWHVPHRNATEDILPKLRKNPGYLAQQGFRVFLGGREINGAAVDWKHVSAGNFPFLLRQDSGAKNALGRIKFMLPNSFAVYLHDTSKPSLFSKAVRNFSSGCVRVAEPVALAEYVLNNPENWSRDKIRRAMDAGQTRAVDLPETVPVYILYWTVWLDEEGVPHFHDDIYERDQRLREALGDSRAAPKPALAQENAGHAVTTPN